MANYALGTPDPWGRYPSDPDYGKDPSKITTTEGYRPPPVTGPGVTVTPPVNPGGGQYARQLLSGGGQYASLPPGQTGQYNLGEETYRPPTVTGPGVTVTPKPTEYPTGGTQPDPWGRPWGDPDYGKNPNPTVPTPPEVKPTGQDPWGRLSTDPDYGWDPSHGGIPPSQQQGVKTFQGNLPPEVVLKNAGLSDEQINIIMTNLTQKPPVATSTPVADTSLTDYFKSLGGLNKEYPFTAPILPGMEAYLKEYTPVGPGEIVKAPIAPYGAGQAGLEAVDYGPLVKGQVTPYGETVKFKSGYSPEMEAKTRELTRQNLEAGLLPGLETAMKGTREEAARRGLSGGLQAELARPIQEEYIKQTAQGMRDFEMGNLSRQYADIAEKAKFEREQELIKTGWDRQEAKEQAELETKQKIEQGTWTREEKVTARTAKYTQDLDEKNWVRNQVSTAMGQEYVQKLTQQDWDRDQKVVQQKQMIQNALTTGQMKREDAINMWNAANTERMTNLNNARQDIQLQIQIAQQNNMFEKDKALRLELAQISKEIADRQSEADEEAGMWGGLGTLIGTAVGLKLKLACFDGNTEILVSKKISDVTPDDVIVGMDRNGKLTMNKVEKLLKYDGEIKQVVNGNLKVADHPFIADDGQVRMLSDMTEKSKGLVGDIDIKVEKTSEFTKVYNLELQSNKTYFVKNGNNYSLVHNGREVA